MVSMSKQRARSDGRALNRGLAGTFCRYDAPRARRGRLCARGAAQRSTLAGGFPIRR
jgi:hypothetical protein